MNPVKVSSPRSKAAGHRCLGVMVRAQISGRSVGVNRHLLPPEPSVGLGAINIRAQFWQIQATVAPSTAGSAGLGKQSLSSCLERCWDKNQLPSEQQQQKMWEPFVSSAIKCRAVESSHRLKEEDCGLSSERSPGVACLIWCKSVFCQLLWKPCRTWTFNSEAVSIGISLINSHNL